MTAEQHRELISRLDWLSEVRAECAEGHWRRALSKLQNGLRRHEPAATEELARQWIHAYFRELLDDEQYMAAGAMAWTREMFEYRPYHISRIFKTLHDHDKVILYGGSGLSKTYSAAVFFSLDVLRDPPDTAVKFASVSETNLKANLWANFSTLIQSCLFEVPEMRKSDADMSLRPRGARPDCGIDAILYPQSTESKGKLKGFHPKPFRPFLHPKWGRMTRVRVLIDEAQNAPAGIQKDLGSPLSTIDESTHLIKIVLTDNPEDESRWVVKLGEPPQGYREQDMDSLQDYVSADGWHCCRLDGARFENVVQRRIVFPGFLTYEGFRGYFGKGHEPTRDYYVFGRGFPPAGRSQEIVVPGTWFEQAIGEPIFKGQVHSCQSGDPAFERDGFVSALGRYGEAIGWLDAEGKEHLFSARQNDEGTETRHCLVVDQLVDIESPEPVGMGQEMKLWAERIQAQPSFCILDKTGNGVGVWSYLYHHWSNLIIGVNWKESSTKVKILADDKDPAEVQADSIGSEMYLTVRNWIDPRIRGFFINPGMKKRDVLKHQLTTRGYSWASGLRFSIEDKVKYKVRIGRSPDEADAVCQLTLVPRMRGLTLPARVDEHITEKQKKNEDDERDQPDPMRYGEAVEEGWVNPVLQGNPDEPTELQF